MLVCSQCERVKSGQRSNELHLLVRRLSQKYKRMPRHLRGRVPEGRDRSGKLFGILFPRHRYSEMHDMHDEVGEMMRGLSVGRQRSYG